MINIFKRKNTWNPPVIDVDEIIENCEYKDSNEFFIVFKTTPYIDTLYVRYHNRKVANRREIHRFTIHEGFHWTDEEEQIFDAYCLNNPSVVYSRAPFDEIFNVYSVKYADWHIKEYYTERMRLIDHIYNCYQQNTAKEILYKAGLDELAAVIDNVDEINLLSSKPSDLYGGLSMKVLRTLNCKEGAKLLSLEQNRAFIKELSAKFPKIFMMKLNDAQCRYLEQLIHGKLTVNEVGRLFLARRMRLQEVWCTQLYHVFLINVRNEENPQRVGNEAAKMDPIYADNLDYVKGDKQISQYICELLVANREEHDKMIRRSNRKRNSDWQERNHGYVVRYPQTANDFCREAVYQHNCLLSYVYAYENNDTTILFMRKTDDVNLPYITIEIYGDTLIQARRRFNKHCTPEEATWIREYCFRHHIRAD